MKGEWQPIETAPKDGTDGSYDYSQAPCRGSFAYNYGEPVLTLECAS